MSRPVLSLDSTMRFSHWILFMNEKQLHLRCKIACYEYESGFCRQSDYSQITSQFLVEWSESWQMELCRRLSSTVRNCCRLRWDRQHNRKTDFNSITLDRFRLLNAGFVVCLLIRAFSTKPFPQTFLSLISLPTTWYLSPRPLRANICLLSLLSVLYLNTPTRFTSNICLLSSQTIFLKHSLDRSSWRQSSCKFLRMLSRWYVEKL